MATRRRPVEPGPAGYTGPLPARIAAGPLSELWAPPPGCGNPAQHPRIACYTSWLTAAGRWSEANEFGPSGWRDLMPPDVVAEAEREAWQLRAERYRKGKAP